MGYRYCSQRRSCHAGLDLVSDGSAVLVPYYILLQTDAAYAYACRMMHRMNDAMDPTSGFRCIYCVARVALPGAADKIRSNSHHHDVPPPAEACRG